MKITRGEDQKNSYQSDEINPYQSPQHEEYDIECYVDENGSCWDFFVDVSTIIAFLCMVGMVVYILINEK